jgi:hypothetical protein
MKKEQIYSVIFYIILILVGVLWIGEIVCFSRDLCQFISEIMFLSGSVSALIRAYKLENYLLLLDKKPRINFYKHFTGMISNVNKAFVIFFLIKPIFHKSVFERERKLINLLTYLTYILIICAIIIMNI